MSLIRLATANLLEIATSLTDTGTATTGYPIARLVDRNVAREYRIADDADRETVATGSVSAIEVNALIIAAGHNVGGLAYTLAKSANGTDWTTVSTGNLPAGTGIIVVEFAATTGAHWKLTLPHAQAVIMTEMMLEKIYTFERNPQRPSGALETRLNVTTSETAAGSARYISHGPVRRRRSYDFANASAAEATELQSRFAALGGVKPFFLCDHAGAWIWGNLEEPIAPAEIAAGRFRFTMNFVEVL